MLHHHRKFTCGALRKLSVYRVTENLYITEVIFLELISALQYIRFTIDTEIKAKRNNMISESIAFRIAKAKAKVRCGVKYRHGRECERSSVQLISIQKQKRQNIFGQFISL